MRLRLFVRALLVPLTLALAALAPRAAHAQVRQPPPVIERIEPTSGPPGTTVQMVGRYFRPEQLVRLAGQPLEIVSRMPSRWTLRIPEGARSGRVSIEVPGVATTIGPDFRVVAAAPPPAIADVQPRTATPGQEVRILGENFSPRITENVVTLAGRPIVVRAATPTTLTVIVPDGAQTGRFVVRVTGSGEATAPFDFAVGAPLQITSFSPAVGPPGTTVTLTGSGFGSSPRAQQVFLGRIACRVVSASPSALVVQLPARVSTGLFMVDVRGAGRAYSAQPFVVQPAPTIAGFEPPAGPPGTHVRVRGTGFGGDVRVVQVAFGGVVATVRGLSDHELVAEVPQGGQSAPIQVTVNGVGPAISPAAFTVVSVPVIADFQPRSGGPGTEVTITGSGFGAAPGHNRVSISGVTAPVLFASPTELRVRIPAAASGPIDLHVRHGGSTRSTQPFVVTSPPFVARFEPAQGMPGTAVTIHGAGFGDNPALVEAAIGDRRMQIRSMSRERIEAIVPEGASSGPIRVTVRLQGSATSQRSFTVLGAFAVSGVEPASVYPGQWLTIRGSGFTASGMQVRFPGVAAPVPYSFVSSAEIRVVVPADAQSGAVMVRAADGREASPPVGVGPVPGGLAITQVDADCLRAGCNVVVRGYGFGRRPSDQTVTIGGQRVRVRRASPHALELSLPRRFAGTTTIRVQLRRGGQSAESAPITITP